MAVDYQECGIVLLMPKNVSDEAGRLARIVESQLPEMKNRDNHYHVSLFHGCFTKEGVERIYKKLKVMHIKPIEVNFEQSIFNLMNQYPLWNVKNSSDLAKLHKIVLETALPYCKGALQRCMNDYSKLNAAQKAQVDKYGVFGVLEEYHPHITLFYSSEPTDKMPAIIKQLNPDAQFKSFKADTIVIGTLSPYGTLNHIVYEIKLNH